MLDALDSKSSSGNRVRVPPDSYRGAQGTGEGYTKVYPFFYLIRNWQASPDRIRVLARECGFPRIAIGALKVQRRDMRKYVPFFVYPI